MNRRTYCSPRLWLLFAALGQPFVVPGLDLLARYPTRLIDGDASPNRARPWEFGGRDVFQLSAFRLALTELQIDVGPADLGIGHSADGAVWALVLPRNGGKLNSPAAPAEEAIAHVWLRFHPKELAHLFPDETVIGPGATNLLAQMRLIAHAKFTSSWHAGLSALIPQPKDLTVDVDTQGGLRRFFAVDTEVSKAEYISSFEHRGIKLPPAFSATLAEEAFDRLWEAFDQDYAMFVLRPQVDWTKLREQYRPKALAATSVYEFAGVCADMLKPLRDLHVWLQVAGVDVPVFNRPRFANANPAATRTILGEVNDTAAGVQWAVTTDKLGYLAIHNWSNPEVPAECDLALEQLRETRGLIVDVRLNGGGSEDLAQLVAGRFLPRAFVYGFSQFRNGPEHTNLTAREERRVEPRGPWRYERPVMLLIGQKCMSSNESFVAMMSGDPELTTLGDHTCGSSGNPRMVQLPLALTVSVPRWIDYLPDGTALDEHGFNPQIRFEPGPGAFDGNRDDLLTAALERLRQPLIPDSKKPGPHGG